jgi:hypothetical protein
MQSPEAANGADGLLTLYAQMISNSQVSGKIRSDHEATGADLRHRRRYAPYCGALPRLDGCLT